MIQENSIVNDMPGNKASWSRVPKEKTPICRVIFLKQILDKTIYTLNLDSCCFLAIQRKTTTQQMHAFTIQTLKKATHQALPPTRSSFAQTNTYSSSWIRRLNSKSRSNLNWRSELWSQLNLPRSAPKERRGTSPLRTCRRWEIQSTCQVQRDWSQAIPQGSSRSYSRLSNWRASLPTERRRQGKRRHISLFRLQLIVSWLETSLEV